jgi:hypothetical protein
VVEREAFAEQEGRQLSQSITRSSNSSHFNVSNAPLFAIVTSKTRFRGQ